MFGGNKKDGNKDNNKEYPYSKLVNETDYSEDEKQAMRLQVIQKTLEEEEKRKERKSKDKKWWNLLNLVMHLFCI